MRRGLGIAAACATALFVAWALTDRSTDPPPIVVTPQGRSELAVVSAQTALGAHGEPDRTGAPGAVAAAVVSPVGSASDSAPAATLTDPDADDPPPPYPWAEPPPQDSGRGRCRLRCTP